MSEDFARHTDIKWNGYVGTVEYGGGDRSMIAIFYTRPTHNPAKSTELGRPIYEDKIYVKIHPPGERLNIVDRPATTQDQRRFPIQWAQFKDNVDQISEGTPVNLLFANQPSVSEMLKAHGVHTIEQLSELSGNAIEFIGMGCQTYVNNAKKYLEMAAKGAGATQLRAEVEESKRVIATQAHEIELLKTQLNTLMENQSKSVDLATIQQLLSGQQPRPQFPAGAPKQMPQAFDAATAQINANSPTTEIAKRKRPRPRMT